MRKLIWLFVICFGFALSACGSEPEALVTPAKATITVDPNIQRRADLNKELSEATDSLASLDSKAQDAIVEDDYMKFCDVILPKMTAKEDYISDLLDKLDAAGADVRVRRKHWSDVKGAGNSLRSICN